MINKEDVEDFKQIIQDIANQTNKSGAAIGESLISFNNIFIQTFVNKYIEDMIVKNKDELYAIFEIINTEYKEAGKCPICVNEDYHRFNYNTKTITVDDQHFLIKDYDYPILLIQANYCPVCGKKLNVIE